MTKKNESPLINGIKTKIIREEGYWRLVFAEPKQARELAAQVPGFRQSSDYGDKHIVLATITRNDFISDRPNWEIQDWRIAPDNETLSPWLCASTESEHFVPEESLDTDEFKSIIAKLRNVQLGHSFESSGQKFRNVKWNNYRGVVMDESRYLPDETFAEGHVWKFSEARDAIGEIKRFWESFTGDSIMEAKRENPFRIADNSDIYSLLSSLVIKENKKIL